MKILQRGMTEVHERIEDYLKELEYKDIEEIYEDLQKELEKFQIEISQIKDRVESSE